MRYSCVPCQRFFKIVRNGMAMEEGMPDTKPGAHTREDGQALTWAPYKIYMADLYECPRCHTQLAVSAIRSCYEHFQPEYETAKEVYRVANRLLPIVEDC